MARTDHSHQPDRVQRIPLSLITESPDNTRKTHNAAGLQELADSLRAVGQQQPIIVRPHPNKTGFEAVFGHRRLRAAELAGWTEIDAIVREVSNEEADQARLHENLARENVHYIDEAEALKRLIDEYGYTPEDLAEQTGKGATWVYGRLKLARLHPGVRQKLIEHPEWSPETLTLVARVPTSLQPQALERITHGHGDDRTLMSFRSARETLRSGYTLQLSAAPWAGMATMAVACQVCPKASHNDPAFADAPGQLCTDPGCWDAKKQEHIDSEVEALRQQGRVMRAEDDGSEALLANYERVTGPGGQRISVNQLVTAAKEAGLPIPQHALVEGDQTSIGLTEADAAELSDALARHHGVPTAAEAQAGGRGAEDDEYTNPIHAALAALPPDQRAVADSTRWNKVRAAIESAVVSQRRQAVDMRLMLESAMDIADWEFIHAALVDAGATDLVPDDADELVATAATRKMIQQATFDQQAAALVLIAVRDVGGPAWLHGQHEIDMPAVELRLALARAYGVDPAAVAAAATEAEENAQGSLLPEGDEAT